MDAMDGCGGWMNVMDRWIDGWMAMDGCDGWMDGWCRSMMTMDGPSPSPSP